MNTHLFGFLLTILFVVLYTQGYKLNKIYKEPSPPPYNEYAKMARYMVHKSNWTSMGTISTLESLNGFPMVNVISIADSPLNSKSTGNIYFLLTILDFTAQDLKKSNRLTMMLSMDQDFTCTSKNVDPMEPTCARIMLSGSVIKLQPNTDELNFANKSMLSRHPASTHWTSTHNFFFCKLDIKQIVVLDYYGGPHFVTVKDYFNANIDEYSESDENDDKIDEYVNQIEERNEIESYTNQKYNLDKENDDKINEYVNQIEDRNEIESYTNQKFKLDKEINIRISKNSVIRKINIFREI